MTAVGSADTRLIIIRGNSGSGKSTLARRIRDARPRGIAIIGQDQLRREILHVHDRPGNPAIDYIDLSARFTLERGLHTIIEGILYSDLYGDMLTRLAADHRGRTHCYRYDLTLDTTLQRHATRPLAATVDAELLATWYRAHDAVAGLPETSFDATVSLDDALQRILYDVGWSTGA